MGLKISLNSRLWVTNVPWIYFYCIRVEELKLSKQKIPVPAASRDLENNGKSFPLMWKIFFYIFPFFVHFHVIIFTTISTHCRFIKQQSKGGNKYEAGKIIISFNFRSTPNILGFTFQDVRYERYERARLNRKP